MNIHPVQIRSGYQLPPPSLVGFSYSIIPKANRLCHALRLRAGVMSSIDLSCICFSFSKPAVMVVGQSCFQAKLAHVAAAYPYFRQTRCKLQEHIHTSGKLPAICRKISTLQASLLQVAGANSHFRQSRRTTATSLPETSKRIFNYC